MSELIITLQRLDALLDTYKTGPVSIDALEHTPQMDLEPRLREGLDSGRECRSAELVPGDFIIIDTMDDENIKVERLDKTGEFVSGWQFDSDCLSETNYRV